MLQTQIVRTGVGPSKVAAGGWWQRWRAPLLPQVPLLIGLLALLCGALWTMEEYTEHRAELRLAETNRFLDQFRSGPVAAAWGRLRTAWRAEQGRQDALFERLPSLTGRERARVLHEYQMLVLETIDEYRLHDEIEAVHQFVNRLAICVRMGSCDADVAAAQLGKALWTFLDQHRPYFAFEYSYVDLDDNVAAIAPRAPRSADSGPPRW